MPNNEDKIINVNYENIKVRKYYTIEEVANKLETSKTKINHWIFKLNKANNGNFFEDTNKISEVDFEKIELAQGLLEEGMSYEEVSDYFKNNSHSLINREEGVASRDLNSLDIQIISKSVTQEVQRQTDKIISTLKDEIAVTIAEEFRKEATKIAQASLEAMNKSKDEMIDGIKHIDLKIQSNSNEVENFNKVTSASLKEIDKQLKEIKNTAYVTQEEIKKASYKDPKESKLGKFLNWFK